MDAIAEDIRLVRSTCVVEDEFRWGGMNDKLDAQWERAVTGDDSVLPPPAPPSLSVGLADDVTLIVCYHSADPFGFDPTISAPSVDREYQSALGGQVGERFGALSAANGDALPLFDVVSTLREWITAHPVPPTAAAKRLSLDAAIATEQGAAAPTRMRLKCTLLWSHHLLATSKRKDIVQWSTELKLWGLSKPGYPGVIVVEGVEENVDEFVHRIKQLQWKALQVRSETLGRELTPPPGLDDKARTEWAMETSQFGKVLGKGGNEKTCVKELEDMGEVGEVMRQAGLGDVFLSALKLNK